MFICLKCSFYPLPISKYLGEMSSIGHLGYPFPQMSIFLKCPFSTLPICKHLEENGHRGLGHLGYPFSPIVYLPWCSFAPVLISPAPNSPKYSFSPNTYFPRYLFAPNIRFPKFQFAQSPHSYFSAQFPKCPFAQSVHLLQIHFLKRPLHLLKWRHFTLKRSDPPSICPGPIRLRPKRPGAYLSGTHLSKNPTRLLLPVRNNKFPLSTFYFILGDSQSWALGASKVTTILVPTLC